MKYSAVIFDWDGTLGMTLHLWLEGYKTELAKQGLHFPDKVIADDFFYEHDKASIKYPDIDFEDLVVKASDYVISHVPSLKLYEDAFETLERLKDGNITLTLVSSSTRKMLEESLAQTGLEHFFPVMLGFDDVMEHKPSPKAFLEILEMAKLDPKKTLIVGDSHNDMKASKSAGLDSCLFTPEENRLFYDFDKLKSHQPTYVVDSLKSFADLVLSLE